MTRLALSVRGIVQGLGFRPAMARAALGLGLTGRIFNTPEGAHIEIQGEGTARFLADFASFLPPGALIQSLESLELPLESGESDFRIVESARGGGSRFSIPPDLALCPACLREFLDPGDRRHLYPFISCGSCGPRYSYMLDLPYDRGNTAMAPFPLCPACMAEYEDLRSRRYHIEGFSCPDCGPALEGLEEGLAALLALSVVAIKGIGGYHLACLADDARAIRNLREKKRRPTKPLAVMYPSLQALEEAAELSALERSMLLSPEAPIVLIPKTRFKIEMATALAPDNPCLGVFLPYSPLHQLILGRLGRPLALTSANLPGDPLVIDDGAARSGFAGLAAAFIAHDRRIVKRADDSVLFVAGGLTLRVRNGRGCAPRPLRLASPAGCGILALGAELKSTITVVSGCDLATSPHIGDLESLPAFEHFRRTVDEMLAYYSLESELIAVDLHPDYESTRLGRELAKARGVPLLEVQHHYAHFLSVLLDTGRLEEGKPYLGLILDGTGYGMDGSLWGGELIHGDAWGFERLDHLSTLSLPGGEAAVREPWRIVAGLGLPVAAGLGRGGGRGEGEQEIVRRIAADRFLSPLTTSCGRLFDAAAAILGFDRAVSFEGEGAIWLEALACEAPSRRPSGAAQGPRLGPVPLLDGRALLRTLSAAAGEGRRALEGPRRAGLALAFHIELAASLAKAAADHAARLGCREIVLSGGVFQNRLFLELILAQLNKLGLAPLMGARVPVNDGGISIGQAAFALMQGSRPAGSARPFPERGGRGTIPA